MTSEQFVFWLQGYFEISGVNVESINKDQIDIIKNHLSLVFYHEIDPKLTPDQDKQEIMNEIHSGKPDKNNPSTRPTVYRC